MRIRPAARVLLIDPLENLLLFHFAYTSGPLAGEDYWGAPGGGVEEGEDPAAAARRELAEETGIAAADLGPVAADSHYRFRLSSGEWVFAHDSYFLLRLDRRPVLSRAGLTEEEQVNLAEARWWSLAELAATRERIIPEDLGAVLSRAGVAGARRADADPAAIAVAGEADIPALLAVQRRAFDSQAALYGDPELPALAETGADVLGQIRAGTLVLAATDPDGAVIGAVRGRREGDTVHIGKLVVLPRCQGRGLGARLMRAVEKALPAPRYELFTGSLSAGNIRLYERLGYRRFAERAVKPGLSLVYMEKTGG